ncbi:MAG: PaaI family thioesterase [Promethearchaeota archaeon]|jgi:acyl-coenzyme A thioesterase PaaI-like protein
MEKKAIQDYYTEDFAHCYGCGRLNEVGMKIKSYWNGVESTARFTPKPYYTAFPGYVYGGLIASLIDCHGTGTAAAAAYKFVGRELGTLPILRYVTASIKVDYIKPTPINQELVLVGKVKEITEKKVIVKVELTVNDVLCAQGEVVAVKIPETFLS